jgi:ribonuclease HII
MSSIKYIIGIDEVGRGPLAGPVTVGVVVCEATMYTKLKRDKRLPPVGKDSKKLKPSDRETYAKVLKKLVSGTVLDTQPPFFAYAVVHISNTIIDTRGISFAIKKAMVIGLKKVLQKLKIGTQECEVRLDGWLKAPKEFVYQKSVIKGDEKEQIIAWASILAKVSRDALMTRLGLVHKGYDFATHKGYGTLKHRTHIHVLGLSPIHRRSFCKKFV